MGLSLDSAALRARWRRAFEHRGAASPTRRWTVFFVCACVAMAVAAAAAWQIACDGPACLGARMVWSAWGATLIVVLVSGALLRDRLRAEGRSARSIHLGIGAMLLLALWLAGYWLGHPR